MAVTVTNKYSNTAGGRSLDVVVNQGEVVTVLMYNADYSPLPGNLQVPVLRLIGVGNYRQIPDGRDLPGMMTNKVPEVVISAPGTYAFQVPATATALKIDEIR